MNPPAHICDLVIDAARSEHRDLTAFVFPGSSLTWADLERDLRYVAGTLIAVGLKPGDNVAVILPNLPLHPILVFAVTLIGAVYMPLDPGLPVVEQARLMCSTTTPAAVFALDNQHESLRSSMHAVGLNVPLFPVGENGFILGELWPRNALPFGEGPVGSRADIAVRRHTGGVSTEKNKLVPLSHGNLLDAAAAVRRLLRAKPASVCFGALPFCDSFGFLFQLMLPALCRMTLETCRHWSAPEVAHKLWDDRVHCFFGSAHHFAALSPELSRLAQSHPRVEPAKSTLPHPVHLDAQTESPPAVESGATTSPAETIASPPPARSLRFALCVGAQANFADLATFSDTLDCPIADAYGSAETAGIIAAGFSAHEDNEPGCVGRIIPDMEISIRDDLGNELPLNAVGEIWVRGSNVFHGYENDTKETLRNDWFPTSDLGYLDEWHRVHLTSRREDRIFRGGFPVYPQEVESVITQLSSIRECAVVGKSHGDFGQELIAFIVPSSDLPPEDAAIQEFCGRKLPRYKIPARFITVSELPRNHQRIILRRSLRDRLRSS